MHDHTSALVLLLLVLPVGIAAIWVLPATISNFKTFLKQLSCWHVLWLFMMLSGLVFRVRDTETANISPLDPSALFRVGMVATIGIVLLYRLVLHQTDWIQSLFQGLPALLAGYSLICLLSAVWSFYPLWTLYKSTEYLVDIALMAGIVASLHTAREFKTIFDWTWFLIGLLIGTVYLGMAVWPSLAIIPNVGALGLSIRGVVPALETNGVGELGAILGSVAFTRLVMTRGNKVFYFFILLFSLLTLVSAQSRSPILGFLLALSIILLASKRIGFLFFLPILVVGFIFFTSAPDYMASFLIRGQREQDFESLSGRTNLWAMGWELLKERPFIGYGAYVGARFTGIADTMGAGNSSILNTWFEIVLGVGIPGSTFVLAAFCGVWVILLQRAWLSQKDTLAHCLAVESLGVLSIILVRSIFTVQLIWHPPVTFLLVFGYAEFIRRTYQKESYENSLGSQLLPATGR